MLEALKSLVPVFMLVGAVINALFAIGLWMVKKQWETDGKKSIRAVLGDLQQEFDDFKEQHKLNVEEFREEIVRLHHSASDHNSTIQTKVGSMDTTFRETCIRHDIDIRDIRADITRILEGQTEWTRTFRKRTHNILGGVNNVIMYVNQLGRGQKPVPSDGLKLIRFGDETLDQRDA